jgi:hypothetical protein
MSEWTAYDEHLEHKATPVDTCDFCTEEDTVDCATCADGMVVSDTCDDCDERHCGTCEPCRPCAAWAFSVIECGAFHDCAFVHARPDDACRGCGHSREAHGEQAQP